MSRYGLRPRPPAPASPAAAWTSTAKANGEEKQQESAAPTGPAEEEGPLSAVTPGVDGREPSPNLLGGLLIDSALGNNGVGVDDMMVDAYDTRSPILGPSAPPSEPSTHQGGPETPLDSDVDDTWGLDGMEGVPPEFGGPESSAVALIGIDELGNRDKARYPSDGGNSPVQIPMDLDDQEHKYTWVPTGGLRSSGSPSASSLSPTPAPPALRELGPRRGSPSVSTISAGSRHSFFDEDIDETGDPLTSAAHEAVVDALHGAIDWAQGGADAGAGATTSGAGWPIDHGYGPHEVSAGPILLSATEEVGERNEGSQADVEAVLDIDTDFDVSMTDTLTRHQNEQGLGTSPMLLDGPQDEVSWPVGHADQRSPAAWAGNVGDPFRPVHALGPRLLIAPADTQPRDDDAELPAPHDLASPERAVSQQTAVRRPSSPTSLLHTTPSTRSSPSISHSRSRTEPSLHSGPSSAHVMMDRRPGVHGGCDEEGTDLVGQPEHQAGMATASETKQGTVSDDVRPHLSGAPPERRRGGLEMDPEIVSRDVDMQDVPLASVEDDILPALAPASPSAADPPDLQSPISPRSSFSPINSSRRLRSNSSSVERADAFAPLDDRQIARVETDCIETDVEMGSGTESASDYQPDTGRRGQGSGTRRRASLTTRQRRLPALSSVSSDSPAPNPVLSRSRKQAGAGKNCPVAPGSTAPMVSVDDDTSEYRLRAPEDRCPWHAKTRTNCGGFCDGTLGSIVDSQASYHAKRPFHRIRLPKHKTTVCSWADWDRETGATQGLSPSYEQLQRVRAARWRDLRLMRGDEPSHLKVRRLREEEEADPSYADSEIGRLREMPVVLTSHYGHSQRRDENQDRDTHQAVVRQTDSPAVASRTGVHVSASAPTRQGPASLQQDTLSPEVQVQVDDLGRRTARKGLVANVARGVHVHVSASTETRQGPASSQQDALSVEIQVQVDNHGRRTARKGLVANVACVETAIAATSPPLSIQSIDENLHAPEEQNEMRPPTARWAREMPSTDPAVASRSSAAAAAKGIDSNNIAADVALHAPQSTNSLKYGQSRLRQWGRRLVLNDRYYLDNSLPRGSIKGLYSRKTDIYTNDQPCTSHASKACRVAKLVCPAWCNGSADRFLDSLLTVSLTKGKSVQSTGFRTNFVGDRTSIAQSALLAALGAVDGISAEALEQRFIERGRFLKHVIAAHPEMEQLELQSNPRAILDHLYAAPRATEADESGGLQGAEGADQTSNQGLQPEKAEGQNTEHQPARPQWLAPSSVNEADGGPCLWTTLPPSIRGLWYSGETTAGTCVPHSRYMQSSPQSACPCPPFCSGKIDEVVDAALQVTLHADGTVSGERKSFHGRSLLPGLGGRRFKFFERIGQVEGFTPAQLCERASARWDELRFSIRKHRELDELGIHANVKEMVDHLHARPSSIPVRNVDEGEHTSPHAETGASYTTGVESSKKAKYSKRVIDSRLLRKRFRTQTGRGRFLAHSGLPESLQGWCYDGGGTSGPCARHIQAFGESQGERSEIQCPSWCDGSVEEFSDALLQLRIRETGQVEGVRKTFKGRSSIGRHSRFIERLGNLDGIPTVEMSRRMAARWEYLQFTLSRHPEIQRMGLTDKPYEIIEHLHAAPAVSNADRDGRDEADEADEYSLVESDGGGGTEEDPGGSAGSGSGEDDSEKGNG